MTADRDLEIEGTIENRHGNIQSVEIGQHHMRTLHSNSGEGALTMGDKGGKKGKDKSQKQNNKKQKQKDKDKIDKQPKSRLLP